MQKKILTITLISFLSIFFIVFVVTSKGYNQEPSNEEAIKTLLLKWGTTWNKRDVQGNLALWHDSAKIMYGRERKIASKKEYADILPKTMAAYTIKVGAPKINIMGDKADVKVTLDFGQFQSAETFYLVRENNKWLIMSWDY